MRRAKRAVMLWSQPGVGKCLHPDTVVLKYDGSAVPASTIKAGDQLLGPDGEPRNVLSTTSGVDRMIKVIPVKGEPWVCTQDHVLTLARSPRYKGDPDANVLVDLPANQLDSLSYWERHHLKLARSESVQFPEKEQPISAYLLGLLLGDGSIRQSVKLHTTSPEIRDALYEEAERHNVTVSEHHVRTTAEFALTTGPHRNANHLTNYLRDFGLFGAGAGTKFIPEQYRTGSTAQRLEILAGLMDTDGYLVNNCFEYVTKSEQLAHDVQFVARSLGLAATTRPKVVSGTTYYRTFLSGNIDRISTRVAYKQAQPRQQTKSVLRTGFSIEPLGEGEYYGWTLDGDGRFLLGDFTITHNTDINHQISAEDGLEYFEVDPHMMERVDLMGLPYREVDPVTGLSATTWATPKFLPPPGFDKPVYLAIEEITAAKPDMQSAMYQLVLQGKVGDYQLPPETQIVACGNRLNDRGVSYRMPTPLANRFIHVTLETDPDDWIQWALDADIDIDVISYINFKNEHLNGFEMALDPKYEDPGFATPRSWHALSDLKKVMDEEGDDMRLQEIAYAGSVGGPIASDFISFLLLKDELPDINQIINDPHGAPVPSGASAKIAVCGALFRKADESNFDSICTYGDRLDPELSGYLVTQACRNNQSLVNTRTYLRWNLANQQI